MVTSFYDIVLEYFIISMCQHVRNYSNRSLWTETAAVKDVAEITRCTIKYVPVMLSLYLSLSAGAHITEQKASFNFKCQQLMLDIYLTCSQYHKKPKCSWRKLSQKDSKELVYITAGWCCSETEYNHYFDFSCTTAVLLALRPR